MPSNFSLPEVHLGKKQFEELCNIVYSLAGISLQTGKESLVAARVSKRLRFLKIPTFEGYLSYLAKDQTGEEIVQLLNVITTNVTQFFREPGPIDHLRELLPEWVKAGQKRFRFWSAACSTGEEPYSMAMTISEVLGFSEFDWKILATDISTKALHIAEEGTYPQERTLQIPPMLRQKYFTVSRDPNSKQYSIKPMVKDRIVFKRLNLSTPPFPMTGPLDAVFCRNVMIYFDNEVRKRLIEEIIKLLKPGGFLYVGSSESLAGMLVSMPSVGPSIYQKSL